jgi:hypothetical protein
MTAYATSTEVKSYLGISGTSQDTVIGYLITAMQNQLDNILGVTTLDYSTYTDEITDGSNDDYLLLKHHPVVSVTTIKERGLSSDTTISGWTARKYVGRRVYFDTYFGTGVDYLVTYVAGYRRAYADTLDASAAVNVGGGIVGIPVTGHVYLASDEVTIAGTTNYNGTYTVSSVSTNQVNIPATYVAETFAITDTIVATDVLPAEIKMALSFMIGGGLADQAKVPGVVSYSILGKSMQFRNDAEYRMAHSIIDQYLAKFKKATIIGI